MFKGWKFFLLGILVTITNPILDYFQSLQKEIQTCAVDTASHLEVCAFPEWVGPALGGAIIVLRLLTTTAIFKK